MLLRVPHCEQVAFPFAVLWLFCVLARPRRVLAIDSQRQTGDGLPQAAATTTTCDPPLPSMPPRIDHRTTTASRICERLVFCPLVPQARSSPLRTSLDFETNGSRSTRTSPVVYPTSSHL